MSFYTVTEPHPTVPQNSYTHSGRGGAGNTFRVGSTTSPAGIPSAPRAAPTASSGRFYSGRGGAGNVHSAEERHALSFAEEYADAAQREKAASHGHVGRGGAGNIFSDDAGKKKKSRKHSDAASAASSGSSSAGSVRSGFWGRLSGASLGHSS